MLSEKRSPLLQFGEAIRLVQRLQPRQQVHPAKKFNLIQLLLQHKAAQQRTALAYQMRTSTHTREII